ncbi:MAG TPA: flagellin [Planctomycetaceae bacterium]|nr:flagellin [Planctomycetaceae bacterium]
MSIPSLLPGRVPLSLATSRLASSIQQGQFQLQRLQDQLSSGKRFVLPSDAPTAATQTLALQKLDERRAAFQSNIQITQGYLTATDQSLAAFGETLNTARGIVQAGLGDQTTSVERQGLAQEAASLIQSALLSANTSYNGRYLFGGSYSDRPPFEVRSDGTIRFNGDDHTIDTFADFGFQLAGSVDGGSDLRSFSPTVTADLNPALTLNTRLDSLNGGAGVGLQSIVVTLEDTPTTVQKTVDLSGAQTLQDIKSKLESAFAAEAITLTVAIDPVSKNGLQLTPSAGTVAVADVGNARTAAELGIRSAPVATLSGIDLNPPINLFTRVADLNGGNGIGATAGTGLRIEHAGQVKVVDLDGAVTVQDLLNRIRAADPDVVAEISSSGNGLRVVSRLSGATFSIGENGGTNAAALGLRTFTGSTTLAELNLGAGVPDLTANTLNITRRDGTTAQISLAGAKTVQNVLDKINAVDPGHLVASLKTTGNGIALTDDSGAGPLTVDDVALGRALGLNGTENTGATGVLNGADVNKRQAGGVLSLLISLQKALEANDQPTLSRLTGQFDTEAKRMAVLRGDVGSRQKTLNDVSNHHDDAQIQVKQSLSELFETDYAETITLFLQQQQAMEAAMQVSSQAMKLSVLQYL